MACFYINPDSWISVSVQSLPRTVTLKMVDSGRSNGRQESFLGLVHLRGWATLNLAGRLVIIARCSSTCLLWFEVVMIQSGRISE